MSHHSSQPVVISAAMAVAIALAGCGGGGGESETRRGKTERSAERTSTTAAPTPIDLSQPIPGGSLHGTPRPPLENTGDDYIAIFESLTANFRWVTENPDVAALSEVFVPGTPPHDQRIGPYQFLVDNGYRWADEGYHLISVEVVDSRTEAASLRVVEEVQSERLVDSNSNQVGDVRPHAGPETYTVLMVLGADGRWRIADATRTDEPVVEV
ncbi:MAG TPA: hypothetical protein VMQ81_12075 [Acidimicrobiia bacterium]|nr:hypothetical protein [Acidimicrobiia bacterium]